MPRPCKCRRVCCKPQSAGFGPVGVPARYLERVHLQYDELEAVRLADQEGLYQEQAAERMNVSRATFGRLLSEAHRKIANALVEGHLLSISGGPIEMNEQRTFCCDDCKNRFEAPCGTGRPEKCPNCGSTAIHRSDGAGGRGRRCRGRGRPQEAGAGAQRCRRRRLRGGAASSETTSQT